MIPFLVVDRPISLRIVKGSGYENLDLIIGLMSHANTSENFIELFRIYPCQRDQKCELESLNNKCLYPNSICKVGKKIREKTVKIVDSGVFTKDGCKIKEYPDLFKTFDKMGADYGIIKDHLNNKRKTLTTAKKAIEIYNNGDYKFRLYGVAQGKKTKDYLDCYNKLIKMGYLYIAIGGLLKKIKKSVRFTKVKNQEEMFSLLEKIKAIYPSDQFEISNSLFALGCYHPKRLERFEKIGIYGADFKGWIFKYKNNLNYKNNEEKQSHRIQQVRDNLKDQIYSKLINKN